MVRTFNTTGSCNPSLHYMVNIDDKLEQIKALIDAGCYFTINRARQYGKTTTIDALAEYLKSEYIVISLDFQMIGNAKFATERTFCMAFSNYLSRTVKNPLAPIKGIDTTIIDGMIEDVKSDENFALDDMFPRLSMMCATAKKPIVMVIDEVDSATNNQVFLDFLAQLRAYYLARTAKKIPTFKSVILAGVYDIKNMKRMIHSQESQKVNSPWNIAADFLVNMSFSKEGISGMLAQYEADYHTGMDIERIASLIYEYTLGYPFLVSRICQLIDTRVADTENFPDKAAAWTKAGFLEAVKLLIAEKNTLFESLTGKLINYPELKAILSAILFEGKDIPYVSTNPSIEMAAMFGFVKNYNNTVAITNRIFESILYNYLLSDEIIGSRMYDSALADKNQFIVNGHLDMRHVLERFVETFDDLYGDKPERFLEEIGRKYFMLFLKPIINGTGHSYIEARTRNMKRTDIVVEYHGEQFVIELKIWDGPKYHKNGEQQIAEYLDFYHLKKGYMITFNFNKKKEIGVKEIQFGDRILVEAVV